jgi:hypothetical protein
VLLRDQIELVDLAQAGGDGSELRVAIAGGMSASAMVTRSDTIWRASQGSVPSLKMTVTAETAVRLIDRISSSPGMPFIAISTGKVRYCSTSSGDSPGALVRMATCVLVTSGTASMESRGMEPRAAAKMAPQIASITPRRRTEISTMRARLIGAARS